MRVVCQQCQTVNQDPGEPLEAFRCGNCGGPLLRVADEASTQASDRTIVGGALGAALGGALAGPVGALLGAAFGGLLGRSSR